MNLKKRWKVLKYLLLASLFLIQRSYQQLSKPVAVDQQIDVSNNKFLQRQAYKDSVHSPIDDEVVVSGKCEANLVLKWMTEVGTSIYATPLIHDLYSDGHKDIVVPNFVHYLQVVEGLNGAKAAQDSWPAYHRSAIHASPLTYDFDFDNIQDIIVATYDGEILIYKDTGEQLVEKLVVPRLKVRKDWYKGLAADFIDHSHPDVGGNNDAEAAAQLKDISGGSRRILLQQEGGHAGSVSLDASGRATRQGAEGLGKLTEEAAQSFAQLFGELGDEGAKKKSKAGGTEFTSVEQMAGVEDIGWENLPVDPDGVGGLADWRDKYAASYGDYVVEPGLMSIHDHAWADEMYFASPHRDDKGFVSIDSHILCTPAIGDIDADGQDELVVAASYFFDREYYDLPENRAELGKDVDAAKFIGGGIVVFDLTRRKVKWSQHLDLSTDHTQFRAYIYSAPTLADLDGDGKLEIIVGTSMGFLYVLDHKGESKEGWPQQMGEIQAQVAVADLHSGGRLSLVAADARGNVAAFDAAANELWERHLGSLLPQGATFGDVNADGKLEVVLGSTNGALYVLDGATGRDLPNFPFYTQGRVTAPVLVTRVRPSRSLQLVVPSHDGHLYVVDGISGCADAVDIGETAYAMVLADDLDGNGRLDLLLATMNGNLYAFQSAAPAHPDALWPSQVLGSRSFTSKLGWFSVAAEAASRSPRDVPGQELAIQFRINDPRFGSTNHSLGPYHVAITLQGVGAADMNAGAEPVIGIADSYARPGLYTLKVPCPRSRSTATVHIEARDGGGLTAVDEFSLSFHMHFHRLLKWLLAGPFALACLAILLQHFEDLGLSLPSVR